MEENHQAELALRRHHQDARVHDGGEPRKPGPTASAAARLASRLTMMKTDNLESRSTWTEDGLPDETVTHHADATLAADQSRRLIDESARVVHLPESALSANDDLDAITRKMGLK